MRLESAAVATARSWGRVQVEAGMGEPLDRAGVVAGGLEGAGEDKQGHEQHQNRPVHQGQQVLGAKFRAGEMNGGGGKRDDFPGQPGEKQTNDDGQNNQPLDAVRAVEGVIRAVHRCRHRQSGLKVIAGEQPDDGIRGGKGEGHRDDAPKQVMTKIQSGNLADHDILWIANQRRAGAEVARNGEGDEERNGVELLAEQGGADDGSKDETNNVVIEKGGKPGCNRHQQKQEARGMAESRRNASGHLVVETGKAELGRDDKKSEQQENGWPIDGTDGISGGQAAENHHRDGAEQRDAHAVELETGDATERDAGVGNHEDGQDDRPGSHAGTSGIRGSGQEQRVHFQNRAGRDGLGEVTAQQ